MTLCTALKDTQTWWIIYTIAAALISVDIFSFRYHARTITMVILVLTSLMSFFRVFC
ncbi:hypothetical protein J3A84_14645 [Proteiniclasticum sp. SCR006]|uniref:Uncharacterized protein n=1 Tax=Proteiniclasticum aestuarii TaxID=2817862 RepID=A0A939HFB5_9CLOT|nr:hypothetical protein [Proteiniclasticum aestuarii]MBO1266273.1 hypothetical protein [Proteiniclasticum aestuarii]